MQPTVQHYVTKMQERQQAAQSETDKATRQVRAVTSATAPTEGR
jgi:hypothetical protein